MKLLREVRKERTGRGGEVITSPSGDGGGEGGAEPGGGSKLYLVEEGGEGSFRAGRRKQMHAVKMSTTVRRAAKATPAICDG